jgi:hypothetical protein
MRNQALATNAALAVALVIFGASVVATRVVVRDVPPLSLAVLRFGLGSGALFLCLAVGARGLLRVARRDLPFLALLGAITFAAFPLAFNVGLRLTEASRGSLMLATVPFWSAVLARAAGRERLTAPGRRAGADLRGGRRGPDRARAPLGVGGGRRSPATGCCCSAFLGGVYGVLAKPAFARHAALTVTAYMMAGGRAAAPPRRAGRGPAPGRGPARRAPGGPHPVPRPAGRGARLLPDLVRSCAGCCRPRRRSTSTSTR